MCISFQLLFSILEFSFEYYEIFSSIIAHAIFVIICVGEQLYSLILKPKMRWFVMIVITEEGDYLALDLGGTNFRVLLLQMRAGKCVLSKSRNYNVPEERLTGDAVGVCKHLINPSISLIHIYCR